MSYPLHRYRICVEQLPEAPITHTPYKSVELIAESEVEAKQNVLWLFRGYQITSTEVLEEVT